MTYRREGCIRRHYVDTSIGQIHYRATGRVDTDNVPIVMLHQVPSTSIMYEALMNTLIGQQEGCEYRIIAPDLPGFGGSDPLNEPVTIKAYAKIIHETLAALGVRYCILFGHHTGASVAVQLEYDFPGLAKKMVLSGPTLLDQTLRELLPTKSFAFPVQEDGSHLLSMWQRIRAKDNAADLPLIQRETLIGSGLGETYPDAYKAVIGQDYAAQLATVKCPTLVFAGTNDPLIGQLDNALALLGNGHKAVIEGATTYVCERHVNQVAALLRDFL